MKGCLGDVLITVVCIGQGVKLNIECNTNFLGYQVEVYIYLNWSELYPDTLGCLPSYMPAPKGNIFMISNFFMHSIPLILRMGVMLLR